MKGKADDAVESPFLQDDDDDVQAAFEACFLSLYERFFRISPDFHSFSAFITEIPSGTSGRMRPPSCTPAGRTSRRR